MYRRTLLVGNDTDETGDGGLQVFGLEDNEVVPGPVHQLRSPTYLVWHPGRSLVLAVSEGPESFVHSYRVDRTTFPATLLHASSVPVGRAGACHLAVSTDGGHVLVACYGGGAVTSHAIGDDGVLTPASSTLDFAGTGPDPERQEAAHPHQVVFDGAVALVPDLGSDRVHRLRLGRDGALTELDPILLPAGMGPRHAVVHRDRLVVVGELDARLWVGRRAGAGFQESAVIRASVHDETYPAALRTDGDKMFASLRGSDTIAQFNLAAEVPQWVREFPVGPWPRDFVIDRHWLWVGHQHGSAVGRYEHDAEDPEADEVLASFSPAGLLLLPQAG